MNHALGTEKSLVRMPLYLTSAERFFIPHEYLSKKVYFSACSLENLIDYAWPAEHSFLWQHNGQSMILGLSLHISRKAKQYVTELNSDEFKIRFQTAWVSMLLQKHIHNPLHGAF